MPIGVEGVQDARPPWTGLWVLVIDDDEAAASLIAHHLEREGMRVTWERDGEAGLAAIRARRPDVLLLDLSLPRIDGWGIIREVRGKMHDLPIIVVTGRTAESDRLEALRLGADDVVLKPFSIREIVARVMRTARWSRLARRPPPAMLVHGPIELDRARLSASVRGVPVDLTAQELNALTLMLERPGQTVTRGEFRARLWPEKQTTTPRAVDAVVHRLRDKLRGAGGGAGLITTVRGVGYALDDRSALHAGSMGDSTSGATERDGGLETVTTAP